MEIRKRLRRELITRTAQIWAKINRKLIKDLRKISTEWLQEITTSQEQEIPKEFTNILQKALREAMVYGYWLQYLYLFELKGNKYRGKITLSEAEDIKQQLQDFISGSVWNDVIPKEAVEWLSGYVPQLAGNLSDDVLEKVRDVFQVSLMTGATLQEQVKALREAAPELEAMTQHRIEAIARTEITRADTMGRLISMKANEDVIGVEFSAVLDDRTTEICASRHGLVMRIDDPRLPENTPPLHVNCRSMILPLTIYDYPDGVLSSHEFDEIPEVAHRAEDIEAVQMILNPFVSYMKSSSKSNNEESVESTEEPVSIDVRTIKEANELAINLGIARHADFTGLNINAVNELIEGIQRNKELFPELETFEFVGSYQNFSKFYYDFQIEQKWKFYRDALVKVELDSLSKKRGTSFVEKHKNIIVKMLEEDLEKNNRKDFVSKLIAEKKIKKLRANSDEYACSLHYKGCNGITLNMLNFRSSMTLKSLESMQEEERKKWIPINCGTIKALIDHEVGHQIDELVKAYKDEEIIKLFNQYHIDGDCSKIENVLSGYANENIYEFIAEAWSEYMNNPNVRPVAKAVGERIIELYKVKFTK